MKTALCLLLLLVASISFSQTTERETSNQDPPIYNDVAGTPYFIRDWSDGIIRFASGRNASQFKIRFDCINNKVLLQFNGSSFSTESKVKEFVLYTKSGRGNDSVVFKKGFPPTEKANEETFYQVLLEGKNQLLCLHVKIISEEPQIASKVIYRRIRDEAKYFMLKDKNMIELPADRQLLADSFPDKHEEIRKFVAEQQLKFREAADFVKLMQFYNSL
jgi:hypothetical protein